MDSNQEYPRVFFDRSHGAVTIYQLSTGKLLSDTECLKCVAVGALEEAKFARNSGVVLEILQQTKEYNDDDDGREYMDDLFWNDGVGKKLEVLAGMVGVESLKPEIVLGEVVRVFKCLEQRERGSTLYVDK